jgi:hypothetical protein
MARVARIGRGKHQQLTNPITGVAGAAAHAPLAAISPRHREKRIASAIARWSGRNRSGPGSADTPPASVCSLQSS